MADLLFLPAPEHRDALLGDGVGGARMPCVYVSYVSGEGFRLSRDFPVRWQEEYGYPSDPEHVALILIWRGEVAQEGCDRLARVMERVYHTAWTARLAEALVVDAERAGLGTVVRVSDHRASALTEK